MQSVTETYDFLVSIIGNVPYGVVALDMQGYITMINEKALQHLNIKQSVNHLIDTYALDYLTINELSSKVEQILERGRKPFDLIALPINDRYLTIRGRKILNGFILTIEDITKSKNAELTAFTAMLEGQETERHRLAKEIHDGVGPLLSTAKLHLDNLSKKETSAAIALDLINTIAKDIRSISHALMPSTLVDFGIVIALDNLCQKVDAAENLTVSFYHSGMEERLEQKVELSLYRITQELLNNALKYANAKSITIQLIKHKDFLILTVEDDGKGFDKQKLKESLQKGIGLRNIQTRTKSIGGSFIIDTQPNRGVLATVEVPI